ncbi:arf1-directed gtpase-activating [Stylonychia lemnae]|uniref:Arf1-directed gtpase-activating n=1 Tax=Stylonychia lemnae TaxID=5949 RepID=A0A078B4G3_STYLE|nr:arf1-directed gtpase-activating [Stylonychia lemnae]|eukprot:CDW89161.1 arf1-directed gtpase-activating [Stylonychia lemnae]
MEKYEQPQGMTAILKEMIDNDPYNKFCVDCTTNQSTHACIFYGTFVCDNCARAHIQQLGMTKSYVKPVLSDLWDDYQMKCVTLGGNKAFWDFISQYKIERDPIGKKYRTKATKYYKRRLSALVQEQEFVEIQPVRNTEELVDRGLEKSKVVLDKAETKIVGFGKYLDKKISNLF